jgi:phosphoglycerol transferase MdoB-like AlkP superfamily enzyme
LVRTLWFLLVCAAFVLIVSLIDGATDLAVIGDGDARLSAILLNALPGILLAWLVLILSRRVLFSFWIAFLLYGALEVVNEIKVENLRTPLLPQDIQFLRMIDSSAIHLFGAYAGSIFGVVGTILFAVLVAWLLFYMERPLMARGVRARAPLGFLLTSVLLVLGPLGHGWVRLYGSDAYFAVMAWSPLDTTQQSGLLNNFVATLIARRSARDLQPPSEPEARKLVEQYAGAIKSEFDRPVDRRSLPDIVIVQSEAFFDPSVLNHIPAESVLAHFHGWQTLGATGQLRVPTFGGGTIRTEFEVLTGISLNSLPLVGYPYLELRLDGVKNLISVLNRHGYDTRSIHANGRGFWNRGAVFRDFGFKHQTWLEDFAERPRYEGLYVSDESMTDEIIGQLSAARPDGAPQLVFAISIENHGPYDVQPNLDWQAWKAITVPGVLSGQEADDFRSYLYHLNHVDVQFDRLATYVRNSSRPTILFFYGDHLPALGPEFDRLGFRNGGDMLTEPVPWLMVSNRKDMLLPNGELAAWMVPSALLHLAGVDDDAFFTLKRMVPADLASFTRSPWASPTEDASPTLAATRDQLAQVDKLRLLRRFGPIAASISGGEPIRVTSSILGSYVTPDYTVGGVADHFATGTPLFAEVRLVGVSDDVRVGILIKDKDMNIVRQSTATLDVDGPAKVNLDLRDGRVLPPGRYQVDTRVDDKLVGSAQLTID